MGNTIIQDTRTPYSATLDGLKIQAENKRLNGLDWNLLNTNYDYYHLIISYFIFNKSSNSFLLGDFDANIIFIFFISFF